MKKNNAIANRLLHRLELERFERRLRQKNKKHLKNKADSQGERPSPRIQTRHGNWKTKTQWVDCTVPAEMDLGQNRNESCDFVRTVREKVLAGSRLRLVFDDCKTIKLSALVLLLAQIHKLRLEFSADHITGTYPENARLERLLTQSGFFKLLKVKSRPKEKTQSKLTRFIVFKSDQRPNSSEIPLLRSELLGDDLQMPSLIAKRIFRALSEAMTNVNHHAYKTKSIRVGSVGGRWWMVASLSAKTRLFTLAFYDAGVGIPKTLPRKYTMEKIRGVLSLLPGIAPDDGQMIRAAMELGRTRTESTNRGLGLMDLTKLIDAAGSGAMHIHSRNGSYSYTPNKQVHSNHSGFVEGTLIEWQLPIDKALQNLPQELVDELSNEN
ncbi:MAG: hypothetical protein Q8R67_26215 [Rhodoferax sp.]|nr:hypothetical protein [Rhodoferax sp.]MDP3655169.1 hypothetical protein [Rhodoferax sp.]